MSGTAEDETGGSEAPPSDSTRLERLEEEVQLLRLGVEQNLRTRRLVVVDELGRERIVLSAEGGSAALQVRIAPTTPLTTAVELFAIADDFGSEVGWCVVRDGEVIARWTSG